MDREPKDIHIGHAIEKRRQELRMTKSELARRIGIPQQHINRMLERDTMETKRLVKVSEALDFNFFGIFCSNIQETSSFLSVFSSLQKKEPGLAGTVQLAKELTGEKNKNELLEQQVKDLKDRIEDLKGQISRLDNNLRDKDTIIRLLDGSTGRQGARQ